MFTSIIMIIYTAPINSDNELFVRLILEINQAGLSWTTILKKKDNFYKAYDDFEISIVAGYKEHDVNRILSHAGIIRNRLKLFAAIYNAQQIISIQKNDGSFKEWLDKYHPITKTEWIKLFKQTFKFKGGEIVNEFLMSYGYFQDAHISNYPIFKKF